MHSTSFMDWTGTHWRTSPFARAEYLTDATALQVECWNDVFPIQPAAAEVVVYVDGALHATLRPTKEGPSAHDVPLPRGRKRVSVVISGFRGPTDPNQPSHIGVGIWLKSLKFNGPAQELPARQFGTLFVGDSIVNGSTLASPVNEAYVRILQKELGDFPLSVLGRGGMGFFDMMGRVGDQLNFSPKKLVREILRHNPMNVVFVLGYNDWFKRTVGLASQFGQMIEEAGRELALVAPHIAVVATGMPTTTRTNHPDFGNWSNTAFNAFGAINTPDFAQLRIDLRYTLNESDLSDGIHPNLSGHAKMANAFRPHIHSTGDVPCAKIIAFDNSFSVSAGNRRLIARGRHLLLSSYDTQMQWLETASLDTDIKTPRFYEFRVNEGVWTRFNGGSAQQDMTASGPVQARNTIDLRRWRGDGSIIKTFNVNYT